MKNIKFLIITLILTSCGGGEPPGSDVPKKYIIAGQSNASGCNWKYFELITGYSIVMIAKGGYTIDMLINAHEPIHGNFNGIIFVHGESDSAYKTDPNYYTQRVEQYRRMIGDYPLYISTVGYRIGSSEEHYDKIRDAVKTAGYLDWIIAYDDAKYYKDWGMLKDNIHFNDEGCELMMRSIADYIKKL